MKIGGKIVYCLASLAFVVISGAAMGARAGTGMDRFDTYDLSSPQIERLPDGNLESPYPPYYRITP
ncbi:MAG TPA: hypothetical protein PLM79_02700 [Syntrophobacteraceae bacterium]|nr:hypothetical protein [Syntrophobacteraceae bacterium]